MSRDADFIESKKPERVYLSREIAVKRPDKNTAGRYISRVVETGDREVFTTVEKEVVIRTTRSGRQQIKAFFLVDDRKIRTLTLQRFNTDTGFPHEEAHFSLTGDEINKFLDLTLLIRTAEFDSQNKMTLRPEDLESFQLSPDAIRTLIAADPKLLAALAAEQITDRDVVSLAYRRRQLDIFERLLQESAFFDAEKKKRSIRNDEQLWQVFFEQNPWIFGYGLFYVFTSKLDNRKLEQIVAGTTVAAPGKRADALLKTRGRVNSLCFAEIKTHKTPLVDQSSYRPDVWSITKEVTAAIAQVQKTVDRAERELGNRLDIRDKDGSPTGETAYIVRPRSVLVIGNLDEFETEHGINETKYRSFELFRRQLASPEILTFDELYERARFIAESASDQQQSQR